MKRVLPALLLALAPAAPAQNLVDIATDATDPNNLADSEPSIAVDPANPQNISVVTFSGGWSATVNAIVWQSNDGGANWVRSAIIPQPAAGVAGPGDQKVAYDRAGNLFVAELGFLPAGGIGDFVYRTATGTANLAAGAQYGNDQPHLEVDKRAAGTCAGRLYSPWLNTTAAPARSNVSNSANQGQAMTNVAVGATTFANRTTRIALAADGRAYVVYKLRQGTAGAAANFENAAFVVQRSDDCGQNWNALGANPVTVHPTATVQTFFTNNWGGTGVARARSSDGWIAVDPVSGAVYVAHVSRDASTFGQIFVARSTNLGQTWTETRVTDGTRHSAYPEIAVAATGAIGVLYIDFTVPAGQVNASFRHRFARSLDRGATWSEQTLQTMDPTTLRVGAGAGAAAWPDGFLWGDYEGLTADRNLFYGVFTGASIGRTQAQPDPIFFTESAGPLLTVTKRMLPASDPGRFDLLVDGTARASAVGNGGTTEPLILTAGTHMVAELAKAGTNPAKYQTAISGDCSATGSVVLAATDNKTCVITNTNPVGVCLEDCRADLDACMAEVPHRGGPRPAQCVQEFRVCQRACTAPPRLTVTKVLVPPTDPGRFNLLVDGVARATNVGNGTTGPRLVGAGQHTVTETAGAGTSLTDYTVTIGGDCDASGRITLWPGDQATCTVTNRSTRPRLTVTKTLLPAGDPGRFDLRIDGLTRTPGAGNGASTGAVALAAGAHLVSEIASAGTRASDYQTEIGGDCDATGHVTLAAGDDKTCTLTNTNKLGVCLQDCRADRDDCMAQVPKPGGPRPQQCVQQFRACQQACRSGRPPP